MRERLKDEHGAIAVSGRAHHRHPLRGRRVRDRHQPPVPRASGPAERGGLRRRSPARRTCPVQGSAQANIASAVARTVAIANAPQVATAGLTIIYQCVVGDRNSDGLPDPEDIPFVCGPTGTWTSGWTPKGASRMVHDCNPFAGDKCNTIRLTTSNTIPYYFAPVIGINTGSTGTVSAASCKGACGAASSPIDVVMVLDRTGSMTQRDVANVRERRPARCWTSTIRRSSGSGWSRCRTARGRPGSLGATGKCEAYGDRRTGPQGNPTPPPTYQVYPTSVGSTQWWATSTLSQDYKTATGRSIPRATWSRRSTAWRAPRTTSTRRPRAGRRAGATRTSAIRWTRPAPCSRRRGGPTCRTSSSS